MLFTDYCPGTEVPRPADREARMEILLMGILAELRGVSGKVSTVRDSLRSKFGRLP